MNILLTSVGRRSYLVNYFQEALGDRGKVVGANMFSDAAGMFASDIAVITPPSSSDEYVPFLLDICHKYDIQLLNSLHDLDVFMLSQQKTVLEEAGVRHTLPSAEWGRLALDKFACNEMLKQAGVPTPWTSTSLQRVQEAIRDGIIAYPLMVKARTGFGSLGLKICHDEGELNAAFHAAAEAVLASGAGDFLALPDDSLVIVQPLITGREICLGIANDLEGDYQAHFACEVHAMRAGESDIATSVERGPFSSLAMSFSKMTRHPGIWGVDCLDDNGTYRVIDVNPRFTGDYPFHHLSGANIPAALVSWAEGRTPDSSCFGFHPGIKGYKDLTPRCV